MVAITPPDPAPRFQHQGEVGGLFTSLVELALADLPEVVPQVEGVAPSPGLAEVVRDGAERWTATLTVSGEPRKIDLAIRLCDAAGECRDHVDQARRDDVWQAVERLMDSVTIHLLREPSEEARRDWGRPPSRDPYATLLAGRAAAAWYQGKLVEGMPQDPVARALKVDPAMGAAQWVHGRQLAGLGRWEAALGAFQRGAVARPSSVLLQLDVAAALLHTGRDEAALQAWEALAEAHPDDPRVPLGRLRALVAADRVTEAKGILASLPEATRASAEVLALEAAVAERAGEAVAHEAALRAWAAADPKAEAPVAQLLALLLRQARDAEAWALLPERIARAPEPAVHMPLRAALAVSVGELEAAAESLDAQGRPEEAARARARAALEAGKTVAEPIFADPDPRSRVAAGRAALAAGEPERAIKLAQQASSKRPLPEALALEVDALEILGRHADAVARQEQLAKLEPSWRK